MKNYLPSKKFIYTLASLILALLIIYGVNLLANRRAPNSGASETETNKNVTMQEFIVSDSDNDGLKNWEEALWKTDPEKSDTDGDSTSDMEEIKAGRSPVKANTAKGNQSPNDKMDDEVVAAREQAEAEFSQLSTTDKVGRILLTQYLLNKEVGKEISQADIANVINNAFTVLPEPKFKKFSYSDIKTYEATTAEQVNDYGAQVSAVILNNRPTNSVDFTTIIGSLQDTDSNSVIEKKLSQLNPLADNYQKIYTALLQIPTPTRAAANHLNLVNAFSALSDNLYQITKSANDPILMLSLINSYLANVKNLEDVGKKLIVL